MTSYLTPSLTPPHIHSPTPQHQHPVERSLDLAEVLESDRYPSILTRLDSGRSQQQYQAEQAKPSQESISPPRHQTHHAAARHSETRHKTKDNGSIFHIEGPGPGPDRRTRQPSSTNTPSRQVSPMASRSRSSERRSRSSNSTPTGKEPEADDHHDRPGGESQSDDTEEEEERPQQQTDTQPQQDTPKQSRSKSPAYVAPIPKIGGIGPISPGIETQQPTPISTADRPELPSFIGTYLVGKLVDEDGDIIDDKTGQLLAHAAGDLPSMVGRRVSNARGDILGDDGELLGYVADIEWPRARPPPAASAGQPRSLFDLMGRATSSLMVDDTGNILDSAGKVVGKFHDNNNPLHRREREEREARERERLLRGEGQGPDRSGGPDEQYDQQQQPSPPPSRSPPSQEQSQSRSQSAGGGDGQSQSRPRRTEDERRQNAEAWRKENPSESPSDIFLDVKSTREGIQLTIRIPTVFNGQQTTPHISFS